MSALRRKQAGLTPRQKGEPTLPLINIVFLMLIFFLVAAQLSRPLETELRLVETDDPKLVPPPDALILMEDATLMFRGVKSTPKDAVSTLRAEQANHTAQDAQLNLRLLPDRRSAALDLMTTARALRNAGADAIFIVTEQALK